MRKESLFGEQLKWMVEDACEGIECDSPLVTELMQMFGAEGALEFVQRFGGAQIYVPKVSSLFRDRRDHRIRNEFTGANHFELARRYGLTVSHVREILRREGENERTAV